MEKDHDLVILGGGPGGYTAAIRASQLGMSVALVEKNALGGTCVNVGCIPTKALIRSASLYEGTKKFRTFGVNVDNADFDLKAVMKYKARCVTKLAAAVGLLMKENKIDVINAHGRLSGIDEISADGTEIRARNIIIATGSRTKSLPSLPVDGVKIITSDHALSLEQLPKSILIVGAGAIGCEFAYILNALNVDVTMVEFLDHALPLEDEDISVEFEKQFERRNIKIHAKHSVEKVELTASGVKSSIKSVVTGEKFIVETEMVLVSVGRAPVTDDIGVDAIGLNLDREFIVNDEFMNTGVAGIRAIGDCTRGPMLAHKASAEGILAVETIAGIERKPIDHNMIPRATYCQPEVASVGMSEKKALEKYGKNARISKVPFGSVGKAVVDGYPDGFVKLIESADGKLVGASVIGPHATDLIATASTAIGLGASSENFSRIIQAHPTLSESWMEASHGLSHGM